MAMPRRAPARPTAPGWARPIGSTDRPVHGGHLQRPRRLSIRADRQVPGHHGRLLRRGQTRGSIDHPGGRIASAIELAAFSYLFWPTWAGSAARTTMPRCCCGSKMPAFCKFGLNDAGPVTAADRGNLTKLFITPPPGSCRPTPSDLDYARFHRRSITTAMPTISR